MKKMKKYMNNMFILYMQTQIQNTMSIETSAKLYDNLFKKIGDTVKDIVKNKSYGDQWDDGYGWMLNELDLMNDVIHVTRPDLFVDSENYNKQHFKTINQIKTFMYNSNYTYVKAIYDLHEKTSGSYDTYIITLINRVKDSMKKYGTCDEQLIHFINDSQNNFEHHTAIYKLKYNIDTLKNYLKKQYCI
jgi:hypothetical protein